MAERNGVRDNKKNVTNICAVVLAIKEKCKMAITFSKRYAADKK